MKALVIEAESQVPKAMAEALKSGKLGVMDYYNMQNMMADTNMRNAIGGTDTETQTITKSKKDKK